MRTTLALFVGVALSAAPVPAWRCQAPDAPALLARARLIEEQEGDLRAAEREYRALLDTKDAGAVHAEAALRLGRMLWRLGKQDEGRPFLERAVAAGGAVAAEATAELQGQGPDGKQAQEIAQKAKEAIDRLVGKKPAAGDPQADLEWLGTAAMPTILSELEARRAAVASGMASVLATTVQQTRQALNNPTNLETRSALLLCGLVWVIAGGEAEHWLRTAAADADVQWRRLVALSVGRGVSESLLPIHALLLDDKDPEGFVPMFALQQAMRLPLERIMPLLASPIPSVREAARAAIEQHGEWNANGSVAAEAMRQFEPQLVKALENPDPQVARQAFFFLGKVAPTSIRASLLYLQWLPRVPVVDQGVQLANGLPITPLLETARTLGAVNAADGRNGRREVLLQPISAALGGPSRTVAAACELVELGYERLRPGTSWVAQVVNMATTEEDLLRIAKLLPVCADASSVANELARRDLPAAAAEPIRRRLEAILGGAVDRPTPGGRGGVRGGRGNPAATVEGRETHTLFVCLGRTGATSILPFLRATVDQQPEWVNSVADAALSLSRRNADAEVSALLRDLMVREDLAAGFRDLFFAELARRGDAAAIPLFARAYELGLAPSNREGVTGQRVGVQWLMMYYEGQQERKLYGFDDAQLTAAWRGVLAGPAVAQVLSDSNAVWRGVPAVARLPIAEAVLAHVDQLADAKVDRRNTGGTGWPHGLMNEVANMVTDAPADASYRAIVAKLCAHPTWGGIVMAGLNHPGVITAMADDLRKLLGGPHSFAAMQRLNLAGIALTKDELLTCLRNQQNRLAFVGELRPDSPPEIVHEVVGMLKASGDQMLRKAACEALGRFLAADSVPALLPMLRDPDAEVVKAATEALDKIRLYHEQKAYWDQFAQGITTGREAATAKLLIQGKPGAPKDQRLLALRSLAALGAPEALPYLIEWAQDADAELAQAAKDAITKIHQQAGVK